MEAELLQQIIDGQEEVIGQLEFMADMNFGLALVALLGLGWIAGHQR